MIGPEYEKGLIALACWRAGSRDGAIGMLAVACVLRNRDAEQWNDGHTYMNAISLPEMVNGFEVDGQAAYPDPRELQFQQFIQNLDAVLGGDAKDITDGGLYYARVGGDQSFVAGRERLARIGSLTFFK